MNEKPLISILTPVYNAGNYLNDCIQSIVSQTYQNWEFLIVDDYSSDNSWEIMHNWAQKDSRIKTFKNATNIGCLLTRNDMFKQSQGDLITFLDADDTSDCNRLALQVQAFIDNPNLGICGTNGQFMDAKGNKLKSILKPENHTQIVEYYEKGNPFISSSTMIKSQIIRDLNGNREFFLGISNEDLDLTGRIVLQHESYNIQQKLYFYRILPNSFSRSRDILYDPFRLHGHTLVLHFLNQRKKGMIDDLDKNDFVAIRNFINEKNRPYIDDPSLLSRELASGAVFDNSFKQALGHSKNAIKKAPFKLINYRTWFYCLRKSLINSVE